ncbi:MAG: pilus assembly PilX N-terminal domain-containing protein, partial [Desulfuromonadales bacterium]|nr:pilus assembly PilX N-terminal domain-containing protein [Desulfuromonadales bacterium]
MGRLKGLDKSNRQKGMALIIAIGFLAVLSILGVTVLTLTNRELKVVADIKPASLAFYVADSAVEYSMNPMLRKYMGRAGNNPIDLMTDSAIGEGEVPLAGGETHRDVIEDGFSTMPTN